MLQSKVIGIIQETGIKRKDIADKCNISEASLSSFLNNRYESNFDSVVKLVHELFPKQKHDLIKSYCTTLTKPRNLRMAMEYAEFNKLYDLLNLLINMQKGNTKLNKDNKDWIKVYELILLHQNDCNKLFEAMSKLSVNTYEMKILIKIFEVRKHFFDKNFNYLQSTNLYELREQLDKISDEFIKKYFSVRFNEFYGWIQIHLDKIQKSRICFNYILNENLDDLSLSQAYHGIGLSYLYEDFDLALSNLCYSKEISIKANNHRQMNNVIKSINFLSCYWGNLSSFIKIENLTSEDLHEKAVIEKIKGNQKKSEFILENTTISNNEHKKGFHYFYKGIITKNKDDFYDSIFCFNKVYDKFYAKLPCLELLKMGEKKKLVDALYGERL